MTKDDHIWQLLSAYFSGDISDGDRLFIEKWAEEETNAQLFREARKIWESAGVKLEYESNSAHQLQIFQDRIHKTRQPLFRIVSFVKEQRFNLAIAAVVTLFIVSYFVISQPADRIVIDSGREVTLLYLPDSSKVWLNANSSIIYDTTFDKRDVELHGEAFFSVRKDTTSFVIHAGDATTAVLGTAFNLKEVDDSVSLSVVQGSVSFSDKEAPQQAVIVNASEHAVFNRHHSIYKSKSQAAGVGDWRQVNNPSFEQERANPASYLKNNFTWRKNAINQSVIEGSIKNTAALAGYYRIVLQARYTRRDGKQAIVDHIIEETIYPGKRISYKKRILDILSETKAVTVTVKSAQVTIMNSF